MFNEFFFNESHYILSYKEIYVVAENIMFLQLSNPDPGTRNTALDHKVISDSCSDINNCKNFT